MIKLFSRYRKDENGQALVEFALILPLFLLLIMGIIQFGFIFSGQITLTSAAREGARLAVVTDPYEVADADDVIKKRVISAAIALLLSPITENDIEILRNISGPDDGMVIVAVDGKVPIIMPLFFAGPDYHLSAASKMRIEYEY